MLLNSVLIILCVLFIVLATTKLKLHAFLALLAAALGFGLLSGMDLALIVDSIKLGFGDTLGKIGIVIIAGTIIGTFLEKSGGAFAMAEAVLRFIGGKAVPLALNLVGYVVSIPVFADSGFVILLPLTRALTKRASLSLATTSLAMVLGLMATHTLMPPTPGPIAGAGILDADLGRVILLGLPISLLVSLIGWLFAVKVASRIHIDPEPGITEVEITELLREAPPAWRAFAPIVVPLILIVLRSVAEYPSLPFGDGTFVRVLSFLGAPTIALLIGVVIALTLPRKFDREMLSGSGWVGKGLHDAAIILMITGAGGAFGRVLQNSGIADTIGASMADLNLGLWLPFLVAAAIRVAQGSSTVAIITTASMVAPLLGAMGLDSEMARALTVLAIGAGSFVGSHANDSMFWILTQMTHMDVKDGFRLMTVGSTLCGFSAALLVWLVSLILL